MSRAVVHLYSLSSIARVADRDRDALSRKAAAYQVISRRTGGEMTR